MVIKVYVSGISASKEVKKRQQRALLILDSINVNYDPIDITEPGREEERAAVQQAFKSRLENVTPLPPQFFNDDVYLGDYEDFNAAVDVDQIFAFLKLEDHRVIPETTNGNILKKEALLLKNDVLGTDEDKDDAGFEENEREGGLNKVNREAEEKDNKDMDVEEDNEEEHEGKEDVEVEKITTSSVVNGGGGGGPLGIKRKESENNAEEEREEGVVGEPEVTTTTDEESAKRLKPDEEHEEPESEEEEESEEDAEDD